MRKTAFLLLASCLICAYAEAAAPVVAVFDIDDQGTALGKDLLTRLADLVSSELVRSGAYQVVPRDDLKRRLTDKKAESYNNCYSDSCQIEIGKELAAEYVLSTQLVRIGEQCVVTMRLFELRTGTANRAATRKVSCKPEGLLDSVLAASSELSTKPITPVAIKLEKPAELGAFPVIKKAEPKIDAQEGIADFRSVDIEALAALDRALRIDSDVSISPDEKIALWKTVQEKFPNYREQAVQRIADWSSYRERLEKYKAELRVAEERRDGDWAKLSRLLSMEVVSADDKTRWAKAFVGAYGTDPDQNPHIKDERLMKWAGIDATPVAFTEKETVASLKEKLGRIRDGRRRNPKSKAWFDAQVEAERRLAQINCRDDQKCRFLGLCSYDPSSKSCKALADSDCTGARTCYERKQCRAKNGACES